MKIKHVTAAIVLTALHIALPLTAQGKDSSITARQVVERIKQNVTCPWAQKTNDTFKAGDPDTEVSGIAVTFMATYDMLRRAKDAGCNFIITHEPTYYHGQDNKSRLAPDAVIDTKDSFITKHGLVIWRFHDHIHRTKPDGIVKGMVESLGWTAYQRKNDPRLFVRNETTLSEFVAELAKQFYGGSLRVVGKPDMTFSRFGLSVGASGNLGQMKMLQTDDVEVLVAGETCEWETVEYVRDASDAGMNKAMIVLGHANSEEAGMAYCGQWLKHFVTEVPIKHIPAGDPFWRPTMVIDNG
jgi:putative NIF3 family GTP cyclohydrolase 1 type 2